jgi:hypothetical protein
VWQTDTNPVQDPAVEQPDDPLAHGDDNTTRLLAQVPDLYLKGAMYYAYLFLQDDNNARKWKPLFEDGLNSLRNEAAMAEYAGSTSQVTSVYGEAYGD